MTEINNETEVLSDSVKSGETAEKYEVIGVRFRDSGKLYFFAPQGKEYKKGQFVIVETSCGKECGEVCAPNSFVSRSSVVFPLLPVIRAATEGDIEQHKKNKRNEIKAYNVCVERIAARGLDMKLIDTEIPFDESKILFYFTSSDRVDFRDLVKDLAGTFKIRIEMRQVGAKDETRIIGGLGICGRPICCHCHIADNVKVTTSMARIQGKKLSNEKCSGICGKLMCCLKYECDFYTEKLESMPKKDTPVITPDGEGTIHELFPLTDSVKVKLADADIPKTYSLEDIKIKSETDKNIKGGNKDE